MQNSKQLTSTSMAAAPSHKIIPQLAPSLPIPLQTPESLGDQCAGWKGPFLTSLQSHQVRRVRNLWKKPNTLSRLVPRHALRTHLEKAAGFVA